MSSGHYRYECKHGRIVMQCKCIGPHEVRLSPCPPSCGEDYEPKHDIDTLVIGGWATTSHPDTAHAMRQASIGSRVFACSWAGCTRVYTRPMIGDPAPGRHRKVDA